MQQYSDTSSLWTKQKFFFSGIDYFSHLRNDLESAQKSVFIETYIFENDPLTQQLLNSLSHLSKKGVQIQIHVDGIGSYNSIPWLRAFCNENKIQFKVFNPLPTSSSLFQKYFLFLKKFLFYFRKFNRRNHRKIILIDQSAVYLGSLNWSAVHTESSPGKPTSPPWRDTGCRLEGPGTLIIENSMMEILNRPRPFRRMINTLNIKKRSQPVCSDSLKINVHRRERYLANKHFLTKINQAKKRIWLTNAYFIPTQKIIKSLRQAALRGVDVCILSQGTTDVPIVKWAFLKVAKKLIRSNVRLYEYKVSMLHAKTMIIDDWTCMGSANLNHRSIFHDLEIEVGFSDPNTLQIFENQWHQDLKNSIEMYQDRKLHLGVFEKLRSELAYRLRYLL